MEMILLDLLQFLMLQNKYSNTLSKIMIKNSFSSSASVKYYGTYVVLSEILGFNQRQYINKIENIYLPGLKKLKKI